MAKLPEIQPRGAVMRGAQSSVSAAEVANPFRQIANGLEAAGEMFQRRDMAEAEIAGQNAVYRDANGNLQVDTRSNLSASGRAYNAAAQQGYMARLAGDIRARGAALSTESKGNIDTFNASWKAFQDQTLAAVPRDFRGAVKTVLETEGPRFGLGVSEQKRTADIKEFEGNIKAEIQLLDDDMSTLARSGGTGTTAYKEKQAQLHTLWGSLAENPDFVVGDKEAEIAIKRMESRHTSESMLGTVDRALATGGVAEARKISQAILTDPDIALTPSERRQYAGLANERINGYAAQVKANLKPVQDRSTVIQKRLKEGIGIDGDDIDQTAMELARGGDMSGAMELYSARAMAKTLQGFRRSDNAAQVAMTENAIRGGGNVVDRIIGVESGGNPNAKNPNSSATGAGQFIDGTWLSMINKYRPDVAQGRSSQEVLALRNDPQLSREMTQRYAEENAEFLRNQGIQTTDGNVYLAHFLGPRGAAQVLKADPNASVASIVGQNVVNANGFLAGKTVADLRAWADKKMGGDGSSSYVDPELIKEYRQEIATDARSLWTDIKSGYDKGMTPAVSDLNLLTRQLAMVDDQDFRSEVADYLSAQSAVAETQGMAPAEVEALISTLRNDTGDGATIAQQQIIAGIEQADAARTKALSDDPLGYAMNRRIIPPVPALDLSYPDSWGPTFQALQNGVDVLRNRGEVRNISALRPSMQQHLSKALASSTPQDSVQLLGAMAANLSPDTYQATLNAIAKGESKAAAAAGALVGDNPEVAEGILRGTALLRQNALLAPKQTDDNTASINNILPPTAFAAGLEGPRQSLLEAARARYADLSSQAGDVSGELNEDRMTQAINEVTGGLVEMNGQQVVAPRYGMTQEQFDDLMSRVNTAGAVTASGQPVTAGDLRGEGRLRAIADGRYVLEFGNPDYPTYALRSAPHPMGGVERGAVFILDLRGR